MEHYSLGTRISDACIIEQMRASVNLGMFQNGGCNAARRIDLSNTFSKEFLIKGPRTARS